MFGLAILAAFAVYVTLLFLAVRWAARRARASGRSPRLWGGAMAAAILLPVFWDWLPTVLVHEYYCRTKTFARVYKSAEQWKAEHPAEAAQIGPVKLSIEDIGGISRTTLNSRFALDWEVQSPDYLPVRIGTYRIVDRMTGEAMAESSYVGAGYGSISAGGTDWRIVKFWLAKTTCGPGLGWISAQGRAFQQMGGGNQ